MRYVTACVEGLQGRLCIFQTTERVVLMAYLIGGVTEVDCHRLEASCISLISFSVCLHAGDQSHSREVVFGGRRRLDGGRTNWRPLGDAYQHRGRHVGLPRGASAPCL